jgi:SAM-dependent methyltransferase
VPVDKSVQISEFATFVRKALLLERRFCVTSRGYHRPMASEPSGLLERVAQMMEVDVRLLPFLPELLADLQGLGSRPDEIADALQAAGAPAGGTVLDLGCGKGAVSVTLAERFGARVVGVDAFPPFLEAARVLAAERSVAHLCTFREGDIVEVLRGEASDDVVLLVSVGPLLGDHRRTLEGLRRQVRPGGLVLIADGFLAEGVDALPGYEGCSSRSATLRQLAAFGDVLVRESVTPPAETRAENDRYIALIRGRAERLRRTRPDLVALVDAYVARQEHEVAQIERGFVCATWILRRA